MFCRSTPSDEIYPRSRYACEKARLSSQRLLHEKITHSLSLLTSQLKTARASSVKSRAIRKGRDNGLRDASYDSPSIEIRVRRAPLNFNVTSHDARDSRLSIAVADREPWSSLDRAVISTFRRIGVILRYHLILPHRATLEQIRRILKSVNSVSRRGKYFYVHLIPLHGNSRALSGAYIRPKLSKLSGWGEIKWLRLPGRREERATARSFCPFALVIS